MEGPSSLIIGLGSAGNLLGATPLALAVEAWGWRAAMTGIAAVTAASAALTVLALRRGRPACIRDSLDRSQAGLNPLAGRGNPDPRFLSVI